MTSSSPRPSQTGPLIGVVRLAWAALLLAAPARILDAIGGPVDPTSVTVARILGARHAIQGMVEVATWPQWRRTGSLVDAAHSLTAAGLGVSAARWRRIGLADSVIAAAFAVAGLAGRQPAEGILRSNSNSQPTSNR